MNVRKGSGMFATISLKKTVAPSPPLLSSLSQLNSTLSPNPFYYANIKIMLASTVTILSEAEAINRCFKQIIMGQKDYDERG